ncbi:MAG: Anti-sigma factor antagonist, partial [Frankiales bacterium]|nr:Anti-sigma factor antagonist [Frankiales bacterium]
GTDEYVVVAVDGDVDISSSPAFRRALEDARAVGAATVVVDLAAVGFMDSTGFGQLVWLASGPGAPAVIAANCRPIVRNALRLMGMDRVLTIHAYGDASSWRGVRDTTI